MITLMEDGLASTENGDIIFLDSYGDPILIYEYLHHDEEQEEPEEEQVNDAEEIFENVKACLCTAAFSIAAGAIAFANPTFTLYQAVGVFACLIVGIVYGKKENLF